MVDYKKTTRYGILVTIIMLLSIMAGCEEKRSTSNEAKYSKSTQQVIKDDEAVYTSGLKDITNSERIIIGNDKPCQSVWTPKKQENTLAEITSWLQQAKLYKGEIPKPKNLGNEELISNAYIGPSILNIFTSDNHKITIEPACYIDKNDSNLYSDHYITNVLEFDYDGKKTYIESNQLFDWLKNDKWETEFKQF